MFGLITSFTSLLSIMWPLARTVQTLEGIYTSQSTPMATLTDTITVSKKVILQLQEQLTYWVSLSVWLYALQMQPLATIVKYMPLSSFAVLYVQIWLGVPIVPFKDPITGTVLKVTGATIIHHYFFDNNMLNLRKARGMLLHDLGIAGSALCRIIKRIPSSSKVLMIIGIDLNEYSAKFDNLSEYGTMNSVPVSNQINSGAISHTMNNVAQLWGLVYSSANIRGKNNGMDRSGRTLPDVPPPSYDSVTGNSTDFTTSFMGTVFTSMWTPLKSIFSDNDYGQANTPLYGRSTNVNPSSNNIDSNSGNPSPVRSLDSFDIVNKGDIPNAGGELNEFMHKRSSSHSVDTHGNGNGNDNERNFTGDSESTSLLQSAKRVASGASASASSVVNRKSSWFRSSSRG